MSEELSLNWIYRLSSSQDNTIFGQIFDYRLNKGNNSNWLGLFLIKE